MERAWQHWGLGEGKLVEREKLLALRGSRAAGVLVLGLEN